MHMIICEIMVWRDTVWSVCVYLYMYAYVCLCIDISLRVDGPPKLHWRFSYIVIGSGYISDCFRFHSGFVYLVLI